MNERIRELEKDALYFALQFRAGLNGDLTDYETEIIFREKFAELIVRECIRVPYDMWDKAELNADIAVKIEHRIKEHFGVEE